MLVHLTRWEHSALILPFGSGSGSAMFDMKIGAGGAPMLFDSWDKDFWNDIEREELKDPSAVSKKNNCNTMDPVEPM